jgi:hypothetical protein
MLEKYFNEEPIPHILFTGDEKIYERCLELHDDGDVENPGIGNGVDSFRNNVTIKDPEICDYIRGISKEAMKIFIPYLKKSYPRWVPKGFTNRSQFVTNISQDHDYSTRDWHLDSGTKCMIGLWYCKEPEDDAGGNLMVSKGKDQPITTIPFETNQILLVANTIDAWHAVTKRKANSSHRRWVNILVEQEKRFHDYQRNTNGTDGFKPVTNFYAKRTTT